MPPAGTRTAVAPARPVSAGVRSRSVAPSASPTTAIRPWPSPWPSSSQATDPDSSVPTNDAVASRSGATRSSAAVADVKRGAATASRNTPTASTATIVPMPPRVITARAILSEALTHGWVVRRRERPVKEGLGCMRPERVRRGGPAVTRRTTRSLDPGVLHRLLDHRRREGKVTVLLYVALPRGAEDVAKKLATERVERRAGLAVDREVEEPSERVVA